MRNAVLFWLKSFIKSSSLALVGGERGKKNLLSGKFSFCSSASVDFCLFALSSGGEGEVVTEELSLD